jgi:hypothetical protein
MKGPKPFSKAVTSEEFATIKESVERAWFRLVQRMDRIHKPKRVRKHVDRGNLDPVRQANYGFWQRWLTTEAGQRELLSAAKRGDVNYFLRQAYMMSGKFLSIRVYPPPKLDVFLINHWAESRDGLPELFYLSPSDLTLVCGERLGDDSLEQEQVGKVRQRLGLKPFRRFKLHPKYTGKGMVFPQVDK